MKLLRTIILAALLVSLGGCKMIYDDRDHCPAENNVLIMFRYMTPVYGDQFRQNVRNVEMAVLDGNGCFVLQKTISNNELQQFAGTWLNLEPGTYRIVCWGNVEAYSALSPVNYGSTVVSAATLKHTDCLSGTAANGDPLFYAPRIANLNYPDASMFTLQVPAQGEVHQTIDFTGAHKTIEVYIKNFSDEVGGVPTHLPAVEMSPVAEGYDYSLCCLAASMCYRQRAVNTSNAQIGAASFYAPLFNNDTPIKLHINLPSDGTTVATVDLKQFLIDNNITLTPGDRDVIQIQVEFIGAQVSITLPAWNDQNVKPVF